MKFYPKGFGTLAIHAGNFEKETFGALAKQPYHQSVNDERDAELYRAGCQLCQEKCRFCVAAVDKGKRETLPEDRAQRNGGQERQGNGGDRRLFHQQRLEQACAEPVENGRYAEHRVIAVAGEQTADKIGHKADQRTGQRPKEHTGQENRHGLNGETGRLVGHRNDEPGQNDGNGSQQRAGYKRAHVLQPVVRRSLRSGHVFCKIRHKKASYCVNGRRFG